MNGREQVMAMSGGGARPARATRRMLAVAAGLCVVRREVTFVRGSGTAKHAHGG